MSERGAETENETVPNRREILSQQFDAVEEEAQHGHSEEFPLSREPAERPRAADGKFVSRETVEAKENSEEKPENTDKPEEKTEEPPVWSRPPASWKKEYHEVWKTLDPRAQQYAFQREEQMRAGVEPLIPKAQLADQITKVAEPYMNTIRGLGVDLPTAVKGLMEADHNLRSLPPEQRLVYAQRLMAQYGINLSGGQAQPNGQQAQDPNYYALHNQLNNLRGEVLSFKQAQEQAQQVAYLNEINEFKKTAEYFDEAQPTMIELLKNGMATNLKDAYTKAIRLNDELSDRIQKATQAKTEAEKRDTANRAAKAAKAAAVSVKTSTPGKQMATNAQTRREMLREQFDGMDSRL